MENLKETVSSICNELLAMNLEACFVRGAKVKNSIDRIIAAHELEIKEIKKQCCEYAIDGHGCSVEDKEIKRIIELQKKLVEKDEQIVMFKKALLTICTADKTAEGLREIAIDACNGKVVKYGE